MHMKSVDSGAPWLSLSKYVKSGIGTIDFVDS